MGGDFFEEEVKETPSKSEAPKESSKTAKKPSTGKTAKSGAKAAATTPAKDQSLEGISIPQQVDVIWAVALVVVAFVVGFFVRGLFLPAATITPADNISTFAPGAPSGAPGSAPALTEDQVQGGLPQGHPNIGGEPGQSGDEPDQSGGDPAAPSGSGMGNIKSDVPSAGPLVEGGQSVDVEDPDKKE